jgi:hypothetical protein
MGIVKVNRNPKHVDKKIYHRKKKPSMKKLSMKKPSIKKPLVKRNLVIVNTVDTVDIPIANRNYDPEVIRKANCCVTISDIDDDSQKTKVRVHNRDTSGGLFEICRNSLLSPVSLNCPIDSFIKTFREFVNNQFEVYKNLDINKDKLGKKNICCIPFTNLPIRVNVGSVFNDIIYFIPDDNQYGTKLKSFIKDNSSAPDALRVIQKFSIASFMDESGKSITTGTLTLHAFLTSLYTGYSWSLDLYDKGLTTESGSIAVYWGETLNISYFIQDNYRVFPSDPSHPSNLVRLIADGTLLDTQFLVILKIGNTRFGVIFQFSHTQIVEGGITTNMYTTPCVLKIPVFYDIGSYTLTDDVRDNFFAAFFNGNPPKNNWFNLYSILVTQGVVGLYTILGKAILESKGLCDALFSFTITKETGIATNDLTTAIRALIHFLSVIYRIYDIRAGVSKGNVYLVMEPDAPAIRIDTTNLRTRYRVNIKKVILQIGNTFITTFEYIVRSVRKSINFLTPRVGGEGEGEGTEKGYKKTLSGEEPLTKTSEETAGANDEKPLPESDKEILLLANNFYIYVQEIFKLILFPNIEYYIKFLEILESKIIANDLDDENKKKIIRNKKLCINTILTFLRALILKKENVSLLARTFVKNIINKIGSVPPEYIVLEFIRIFDYNLDSGLPTYNVFQKIYDLYEILNIYDSKLFSDDIFVDLVKESDNLYTVFVNPDTPSIIDLLTESQGSTAPGIVNIITQLKKFKVKDEKEFNELVSKIEFLITKSPIKEKYKLVQELSAALDDVSKFISLNQLSYILVSCFTSNEMIAKCITKELTSITSMHGVSIFDIQIIEAFVDGIDIDPEYGSIIYLKDYNGINTLINIKKYIGGEVLDFLTDNGFSLKQIGDFVDDIIYEIESDNLDNEEAIDLVTEYMKQLEPLKQKFQQQQQQQQQQQLKQQQQQFNPLGLQHVFRERPGIHSGMGGGNNIHTSNPKSKHNAKYRKKYKKFVSKYIIKKNKKQNKNQNKSTHSTKNNTNNKTRKNKRLTKPKHGSKSKSKYTNKTLKNKKRKSKSKSSNHKSKHNKKAKTNYYNIYKHNKTLKH